MGISRSSKPFTRDDSSGGLSIRTAMALPHQIFSFLCVHEPVMNNINPWFYERFVRTSWECGLKSDDVRRYEIGDRMRNPKYERSENGPL